MVCNGFLTSCATPNGQGADRFQFGGLDELHLGGFQIFMRLFQIGQGFEKGFLGLFLFGDVPVDSLNARDLPLGIVNGYFDDVDIDLLSPPGGWFSSTVSKMSPVFNTVRSSS